IALALAAFARTRDSLELEDLHMPEVAPPESLAPTPSIPGRTSSLRERLEQRRVFGSAEPGTGTHALTGGWMRLAELQVPDAPALALFCDSWPPALAQLHVLGSARVRGVPTIDLTVHFRAALPANARAEDFYLCVFRTRTVRNGFLEEDGELWTRDGVLLAQSRQLALLV
ncbi:MAG: acyl-CoA thioesterase, partial [Solirubrobacteraceae bacterium]